jgi:hypothetical protein
VPESPPPPSLFSLEHPLVVGLTTNPDRLIQIRRNRLLALNQAPETDYVDIEAVNAELAFARRMFADNDWPVIDVTRRSIEETALAIVKLCNERMTRKAAGGKAHEAPARLARARRAGICSKRPACRSRRSRPLDEEAAKAGLGAGFEPRDIAEDARRAEGEERRGGGGRLVLGADQTLELDDGTMLSKPGLARGGAGSSAPQRRHPLSPFGRGGREAASDLGRHRDGGDDVRPLGEDFLDDYLDANMSGPLERRRLPDRGDGRAIVRAVEGSHFAILGLPLLPLLDYLRERGVLKS